MRPPSARIRISAAMRNITCFVILIGFAGFVLPVAAQQSEPVTNTFLVRMFEREMTLQPVAGPNNIGTCMTVLPNGKLHLELQRQEFFDGHATVSVYESSLSQQELQSLHKILDDQEIKRLPAFVQPKPPLDAQGFQVFTAEIMHGPMLQSAGYYTWKVQPPGNTDSDKEGWKQSELAIKPLVDWFHAIKSFKTSNWRHTSNSKANVCGTS